MADGRKDVFVHNDSSVTGKIGRTSNGSITFEVSVTATEHAEMEAQLQAAIGAIKQEVAALEEARG